MDKLKMICASFLAAAVLASAAPAVCGANIYDKVTRLHIRAASDSAADQEIKLKVRDAVLQSAELRAFRSPDEKYLEKLTEVCDSVLRAEGAAYRAKAEYKKEYFGTRDYDTFSLPAGEYRSVIVELGPGEGENWWCVLFPPLCLCREEKELSDEARKDGIGGFELAVIKKNGNNYSIRFKILDFLGKILQKQKK